MLDLAATVAAETVLVLAATVRPMTFFDLTVPLENGMTFYPGDPEPRIARADVEPPWTVSELRLGSHTGTHIDAARHYSPPRRRSTPTRSRASCCPA